MSPFPTFDPDPADRAMLRALVYDALTGRRPATRVQRFHGYAVRTRHLAGGLADILITRDGLPLEHTVVKLPKGHGRR
ncbi:hypothetical protein [Candidatus Methylocalor cossyra]|uniref:Uncharacterized protein n=1 Tax=Candidatus Methylocalor cossyra TaxID=3108543 RepID=A0ABP1CCG4_9GAMM